jgi:hypothetical protein
VLTPPFCVSPLQRFGGYDEVTNRKLWRTIGSSFGPPGTPLAPHAALSSIRHAPLRP